MTGYSDVYFDSHDLRVKLYARDYGGDGMPVICMHGLSRNSTDFEVIAPRLAERYRVIAVDQRGRGKSGWDAEPANYSPALYVQDMFKLMGELGIARAALIGTSMGGIMAMIMAMIAPQALIGMVINDVGPEIDVKGLERIKSYVGKSPPITSWADAAARAKQTNAVAFPDYSDDDWLAFARRTYHERDGIPVSSYDPGISGAFDPDGPVVAPPDMWGIWETLKEIPVLGVRGELSDLLSEATFGRMLETHPGMRAVTVANRGHAPMLDEPEAISAIEAFLADLAGQEK
ncbi:alpha/beta hydrolase [Asticcacaulis sp.]|uniref:alpha/beta fold hydrolase n=1 Tax=Asticcacaulis sp. TaxID=1872648 RepID=UPI002BC1BB52|nr:alpha/beta hydrolase [Asticcacaulis sp.]HTM81053.1 alpha/beta hydrolase [Asticcacaulis sp.]